MIVTGRTVGRLAVGLVLLAATRLGSTYDPCGGKHCGDFCNLCEPGSDCMETEELKVCTNSHQCVTDTGDILRDSTSTLTFMSTSTDVYEAETDTINLGEGGQSWATVTGQPTFDLLATDHAGSLVVFDSTGTIIFSSSVCGGPKDQHPDHGIVCLTSDGVMMPAKLNLVPAGSGSGSGSQVLTPYNPATYSHEARFDDLNAARPTVLTFAKDEKPIPGLGVVHGDKLGTWFGWNHSSAAQATNAATAGLVTFPINLFDHFDPRTDWGAMSTAGDWTHANSAGTGSANNLVLGIRHLSAVASFNYESGALEWVLSSECRSNFTFTAGVAASGYAEFYNGHDAKQTATGTITIFDNGNSRPVEQGGQYSRGVEYELDFVKMEAKLVWEFVTGSFGMHGGSVDKMDNGHYIVSESCDAKDLNLNCTMMTWEVDTDGNELAKVVTPKIGDGAPGYRTEIWKSGVDSYASDKDTDTDAWLPVPATATATTNAIATANANPPPSDKTKWCADFEIETPASCTDELWEGVLKDMFSPDDTCPDSTRYIDGMDDGTTMTLEVSASGTDDSCNSTWGRRFNATTTVNPVLSHIPGQPCAKATSFVSKVPVGDAMYDDAQNGALNFTLKLGTVNGTKVSMWNGVYNGQGGGIQGNYSPPSDCDNFWLYLDSPKN